MQEEQEKQVKFSKEEFVNLIGNSKCTYVKNGANFIAQEIYQCKTCELNGVCTACFENCHKEHDANHTRVSDLSDETSIGGMNW